VIQTGKIEKCRWLDEGVVGYTGGTAEQRQWHL
jgi:hypothetical protein